MGSYTQLARHMTSAARGSNRRGLGSIQRDPDAALSQLPRGANTPVRVMGTVHVDDAGTLRVEGEGGARVRIELGAATATGTDGEVLVLRHGERVDVLGQGERMRGAGQGYRDAEGEFVFGRDVDILRLGATIGTRTAD